MTDTQKKYFLAVAKYLNFSKASESLFVSQPAVSKSIISLEEELGVALFARSGKYVRLTGPGELFRDFLLEYDRSMRAVIEHMRSSTLDIHTGTVNIVCSVTWNAGHFYNRLSRNFSVHSPGMNLNVEAMEPEAFISALRDKQADAVIMYSNDVKNQNGILSRPLTSIGRGFLVSSGLVSTGSLSSLSSALSSLPLFVVDSSISKDGALIYDEPLLDYCRSLGVTPRFRHCRSLSSALVEVSCGKGILLVDDWSFAVSNPEFRYFPTGLQTELCIAHSEDVPPSSHVRFFIDEACRVFENNI